LRLQPTDQVVDIGCGTGLFSGALYTKAGLTQNILAVEQSEAMLNHAQTWPGLTTYGADALSFVQDQAIRYNKVLMKEVVHHIRSADLPQLYRGVYQQLHQGGILVTVTRPAIVHYPFFQAALELWQKKQPPVEPFVKKMEDAGFSVSYQTYYYPVQIAKTQWLEMIRNRFWSTFSYFNDEELEAGLAELEAKYAQTDTLYFDEALILIEAVKS